MSEQLGAQIQRARKCANLSQSQLAGKIGAHVTSVSDWERGRNAPSARHLLALAKALGRPIEDFTDDAAEEADVVANLTDALRAYIRAETATLRAALARAEGRLSTAAATEGTNN